jgi:hypothetical protein
MSEIKRRINVKTKGKLSLVVLLGLLLISPGTFASADDHGPMGGNGGQHIAYANRHSNHYYRNGRWYRHGWFGFGVAEPVLSAGVYIDTLPPAYTPVVIQGTTYYYGDNTYFTQSPQGGYTVVVPPSN